MRSVTIYFVKICLILVIYVISIADDFYCDYIRGRILLNICYMRVIGILEIEGCGREIGIKVRSGACTVEKRAF